MLKQKNVDKGLLLYLKNQSYDYFPLYEDIYNLDTHRKKD